MADRIEVFRNHIIAANLLDPVGVHHEFASGMHGRKLDFDSILEGDPLLNEWANVSAEVINQRYPERLFGRIALLSVATGTDRMVGPIASRLGPRVTPLLTVKVADDAVELPDATAEELQDLDPDMIVAFEDTGTSGTVSASAVVSVRRKCPYLRAVQTGKLEVMNTCQRRQKLEKLIAIDVPYNSITIWHLPTYKPIDCIAVGYCAIDPPWILIKRKK